MIQDSSIIVCKICGQTKTRLLAGRYKNGKDKKWVNESGLEFNGHTCPPCHQAKVAEAKRLRKAKADAV